MTTPGTDARTNGTEVALITPPADIFIFHVMIAHRKMLDIAEEREMTAENITAAEDDAAARASERYEQAWGLPDESVKEIIAHHTEVSAGVIAQLIKKLPETPREWR